MPIMDIITSLQNGEFFARLLSAYGVLSVQVELNLFDATKSSSARVVPCSDPICAAIPTTTDQCLSQADHCGYTFHYRDRSGTSGFYVTDLMHFDILLGESTIANSSAPIVFG